MTISFCSLQPAWEAHYAAPANPTRRAKCEGGCGVGGRGGRRVEAGFDLFALDQPAEPGPVGGGEEVSRVGLLLSAGVFVGNRTRQGREVRRGFLRRSDCRRIPPETMAKRKVQERKKNGQKKRREIDAAAVARSRSCAGFAIAANGSCGGDAGSGGWQLTRTLSP